MVFRRCIGDIIAFSRYTRGVKQLDRLFVGILLIIFGGIVLHAPLTIIFGAIIPDIATPIKAWKEILMVVAGVLMLVVLKQRKKITLLKDPLLIAAAVYVALNIMLVPFFWQGLEQSVAGLIINLRYIVFFGLVYIALKLYPDWQKNFVKVGIAGALVVVVFGVLQVTVLPADVLKYIGYSRDTIVPYLTVDQNPDYVRINSTLRGPNPLGAYAGVVLAAVAAYVFMGKLGKNKRAQVIAAILGAGGLVCLWASYSRSALVAGLVALCIVFALTVGRRLSRKVWITGVISAFAVVGGALGILATTQSEFVSNVLLHENLDGGSEVSSNEGHHESVTVAIGKVLAQPFGGGIGSTGSASLLGDTPLIIENQYLFIAHEVGWIGLIVFLLVWLGVLSRLWQYRRDWLAVAAFASGIGMVLIGILLPVWVDDTVAIIWWGLAAIALSRGGKT